MKTHLKEAPSWTAIDPRPSHYQGRGRGVIILKQFVTEVHTYLNEYMDHVKKALHQMYAISVNEQDLLPAHLGKGNRGW